jgi:hypothetical protein
MKLRFPLSHRACYQRPTEPRVNVNVNVKTEAVGGLSTAII